MNNSMPTVIVVLFLAGGLAGTLAGAGADQDDAFKETVATEEDPRALYDRFTTAEDWRESQAAGRQLVALGKEGKKLLLRGAEHDEDAAVRRRCWEVLIRDFASDERMLAILANDGLADDDRAIRYMAAFHLGDEKVYGAFRRLRNVIGDPEQDEMTRYAAAKSLAELGDPEGLPLLYDGLGSDWYMPRYLSNLGIRALTGKDLNEFDYDYSEGAFVSGGVEARTHRRPIEDAERRARRHTAIAAYCRWLKGERPELYKHLEGTF
jgi:hypothetical protein